MILKSKRRTSRPQRAVGLADTVPSGLSFLEQIQAAINLSKADAKRKERRLNPGAAALSRDIIGQHTQPDVAPAT